MTPFDLATSRLRRALENMMANARSAEEAGLAGDARRWRVVRTDVAAALGALTEERADIRAIVTHDNTDDHQGWSADWLDVPDLAVKAPSPSEALRQLADRLDDSEPNELRLAELARRKQVLDLYEDDEVGE